MPLAGFEPTISAGECLQAYAFYCAATRISFIPAIICCYCSCGQEQIRKGFMKHIQYKIFTKNQLQFVMMHTDSSELCIFINVTCNKCLKKIL
jgi:hypothetical protein